MFAASFCVIALIIAQDHRSNVRTEMDRYYQTNKWSEIWHDAFRNLSSTKPEIRQRSVAYLVDLLDQAVQDEKSGKAPWQATPFWGEGAQNQGRELRRRTARPLADGVVTPEALPLVQWLLENEPQADLQETAVGALGRIDGEQGDELRFKLVHQPHPNAIVMGMLLAQLRKRKLTLPAEQLKELCHHHRKVIRENARKLNEALNGPDPGKYDQLQAFKSPAVRKIIDELQTLLIDLPAKDAEFVEVTIRYLDRDAVKETEKARGWLLKQDKNEITIFSPHGNREVYRDKQKTKITVSEPTGDGVRYSEIDVVISVSVDKPGIEGFVKEIAHVRAEGNKDFELSERGGLTGQFQGQGASLTEVILAAWLDRAGKPQLAASILLPALDTLYEDQHIIKMTRHQLGDLFGHRMLAAFVGDRDYEKAGNLARTLMKHYPNTRFFTYAKGLLEQLPRRMDDFKTLKLPTPAEWAEMKKKMSRSDQINFLCGRLRLLNCFQMGQPDGYSESEKQYGEPCGLSDNAAWGLGKGKTEVINPVVELIGNRSETVEDNKKKPQGLNLVFADIPDLVPFLKDDWYLLIVSFWRDFHPDRTLERSRPFIADLINGLALHDLCELERFQKMPPAEQEKHIQKILAWVDANKGKSQAELLIIGLQAEVERGAHWAHVYERIEELVEKKDPIALTFLEHYIAMQNDDNRLWHQMRLLRALDPKRSLAWTNRLLEQADPELRMQAGMMVLGEARWIGTGDPPVYNQAEKERVVPVLAKLFEQGSFEVLDAGAKYVVPALLKLGTKEAIAAARGIMRNKVLHTPEPFSWDERPRIITALAKAGYPEGYQIYLDLLDVKGNEHEGYMYAAPVAKLAVDELLRWTVFADPALEPIRKIKDFEQQRLAVRRWVEEKRNAVEKK
jgi:hypothetical protein